MNRNGIVCLYDVPNVNGSVTPVNRPKGLGITENKLQFIYLTFW